MNSEAISSVMFNAPYDERVTGSMTFGDDEWRVLSLNCAMRTMCQ